MLAVGWLTVLPSVRIEQPHHVLLCVCVCVRARACVRCVHARACVLRRLMFC
jgi:hypothetical protein